MDTLDIIAGRVLKCRVLKKNPIIVQLSSILFWGGEYHVECKCCFFVCLEVLFCFHTLAFTCVSFFMYELLNIFTSIRTIK